MKNRYWVMLTGGRLDGRKVKSTDSFDAARLDVRFWNNKAEQDDFRLFDGAYIHDNLTGEDM